MGLLNVFDIAGSAMSANTVRLNATASNLSNAESVSGSAQDVYRARQPIFQAVMNELGTNGASASVRVSGVAESQVAPQQRYAPEHPLANEQGYIYMPTINTVDEMANMIATSRAYQNNVEVLKTSKQMLMATLRLGQ